MAGTFLQCRCVRRIMAQCRSSNIKKVNCKHVYVYTCVACVDEKGVFYSRNMEGGWNVLVFRQTGLTVDG